jgi:hypothetical protein
MTDRELMQQALEALDWAADCIEPRKPHNCDCPICVASDALLQRLAQPQRTHWEGCEEVHPECKKTRRREWVGLTDEEFVGAIDEDFDFGLDNGNVSNVYVIRYARAIEAKLKEKNNG